jgi:O-antigen/teichoic acid export membrane protein
MPEESKNSMHGQVVRYAMSSFARHILSLMTSFVRAKLLAPELYGIWVLIKTFPAYGSHLHLGTQAAMYYGLPKHIANDEHEQIKAIEATSLWGTIAFNLVFCGAIVVSVMSFDFGSELEIGLLLACPVILLTAYYEHINNRFKAMRLFDRLAVSHYLFALFLLPATALLAWLYGLAGVLIALILTFVATLLYLLRGHQAWWPLSGFDRGVFVKLIRMGFPIVILSVMYVFMMTSDRFLIVSFLETSDLGLYGLAVIVIQTVLKIPGVSREVIEPETMAQAHSHHEVAYFERFYGRPLLYIAFFVPVLIGGAAFTLEPVLLLALPEYAAVLPTAQTLLFGAYFLALTLPSRGVIVAAGKQTSMALYMLFPLTLGLTLSAAVLAAGYGIEEVAFAKGVTFATLYLTINLLIYRNFPHFGGVLIRYITITTLLFLYIILLAYGCSEVGSEWHFVYRSLTRTLLFMVGIVPPLLLALRFGWISWPRKTAKAGA